MDETALLMLMFMGWGLACICIGFVLGMVSKISPYIRYLNGLVREDGDESDTAGGKGPGA